MYKRFFYSKTRWQVLKSKKGRRGKERKRKGKIKLKRKVRDQQAKSLCGVCVTTAYWEQPMEFGQCATSPQWHRSGGNDNSTSVVLTLMRLLNWDQDNDQRTEMDHSSKDSSKNEIHPPFWGKGENMVAAYFQWQIPKVWFMNLYIRIT